jgi:hypothetical protein
MQGNYHFKKRFDPTTYTEPRQGILNDREGMTLRPEGLRDLQTSLAQGCKCGD